MKHPVVFVELKTENTTNGNPYNVIFYYRSIHDKGNKVLKVFGNCYD